MAKAKHRVFSEGDFSKAETDHNPSPANANLAICSSGYCATYRARIGADPGSCDCKPGAVLHTILLQLTSYGHACRDHVGQEHQLFEINSLTRPSEGPDLSGDNASKVRLFVRQWPPFGDVCELCDLQSNAMR